MLLKIAGAPAIRAFATQDIPEVADLWQRCFRHTEDRATPAVRAYFQEIFLENPWADESLPSLVYEGRDQRIIGFIGVIPRPMTFNGKPIRAAIASQLMIDPTRKAGFAALELMRRFFAGGQDLSFSDGANDSARRVWERCGGQAVPLYSLEWTRVLRPMQHLAQRLRGHDRFGNLARVARPFCLAADCVLAHLPASIYCAPAGVEDATDEPTTAQTILGCLEEFPGPQSLRPHYNLPSLDWLLRQAGRARSLGELRCRVVHDQRQQLIGWYIYFVRPGGEAQVLHLCACSGSAGRLLNCLFGDAWSRGAVAVSGGIDPRFMTDLAEKRCHFTCPGLGILAQSSNPQVLSALHRGDATLTRLDGEWWLRLGIDRRMQW